MCDALTPKEARQMLGVSAPTFRKHELRGDFNALRLSQPVGRKRFSRSKFQAFVDGELTRTFSGRIAFRKSA